MGNTCFPYRCAAILGLGLVIGRASSSYAASPVSAAPIFDQVTGTPLPGLDLGTPLQQGGYTLLKLKLMDENGYADLDGQYVLGRHHGMDGTALWILPPWLPPSPAAINYPSDESDAFRVKALLSTGDRLPLPWNVTTIAGQRLLFTYLPGGYPDSCHWADITVQDKPGHVAHWRISPLPRMWHAVQPTVPVSSAWHYGGASVVAQAWLEKHPVDFVHPYPTEIFCGVTAHGTSSLPHHWEIELTGEQAEWEPFSVHGFEHSAAGYGLDSGILWSLPYAAQNHQVRLRAELRQFDTLDESIAFHHLKVRSGTVKWNNQQWFYRYAAVEKPQTVITASGVRITLPVQGTRPLSTDSLTHISLAELGAPGDRGLYFKLIYPRNRQVFTHSRLYQRYHRSIAIQLEDAPSFRLRQEGPRSVVVETKGKPVQYIPTLALRVQQRADLQKIPLAFTVPVAADSPNGKPGSAILSEE